MPEKKLKTAGVHGVSSVGGNWTGRRTMEERVCGKYETHDVVERSQK